MRNLCADKYSERQSNQSHMDECAYCGSFPTLLTNNNGGFSYSMVCPNSCMGTRYYLSIKSAEHSWKGTVYGYIRVVQRKVCTPMPLFYYK